MHHVRLSSLTAAMLVASVFVGCQTEPTVNRVQPNVVDKDIFAAGGEWYYQQTVIDTPYGAGYTFVGEQGDLEKIEWEIQEHFLIARRSYDYISGSESGGISSGDITVVLLPARKIAAKTLEPSALRASERGARPGIAIKLSAPAGT